MFPIEFFWRAVERFPAQPAVQSADETLSYRELAARVSAVAAGILGHDGTAQSRVAVGGANSVQHLVAILATLAAGKTWVPLNPRNGTPELARLVAFTEPTILLLDEALAARLQVGHARTVLLDGGARDGLDAWQAAYADASVPRPGGSLGDVQAIKFTGGTTGAPKGVMQTCRAWNTTVVTQWREFGFDASDRFLVSAPLTHGASTYILPILGAGGTLIFPAQIKPGTILDAVQAHGVTTLFMPPTLIYALMQEFETQPRDLRSLRRLIYGAAPMPPQKILAAQRVFGPVLATTYGQTEAPQVIACLRPQELADERNIASVGRPTFLTEVRVAAPDGRRLPAGEAGEILVRGDLVMSGYWRSPQETAATLRDGWLHTGDIGMFDERGMLYLKDRLRDVIISGGFNVYPSDVEQVINRHPAVFDCAVFGVPDEKWGETVQAAVVLRDGARIEGAELIGLVRAELGAVKAPKAVHFMASLPRSAVDKTLKSALREAVAHEGVQ